MKITHDYFLTEWHRFREIMCSTDYTPEQKLDAWGGLLYVYFMCESSPDEETKTRESAMRMLIVEFPMRMGLEAALELELLFRTGLIAEAFGDTEALEMMFKPKVIDIGGPDDKRMMNGGTNGN